MSHPDNPSRSINTLLIRALIAFITLETNLLLHQSISIFSSAKHVVCHNLQLYLPLWSLLLVGPPSVHTAAVSCVSAGTEQMSAAQPEAPQA